MKIGDAEGPVQFWLKEIAQYERDFKKWETRSAKIIKRFRDEGRDLTSGNDRAKFNILWSNVNTLIPACFSRTPQPDVSRRFKDNDPVGRVASLILERGLEFETQHYSDYKSGLTNVVQDRFLGGRGTAWVRYEPHFRQAESQITEDVEPDPKAESQEELDYECAPVDYVNPKDFGHTKARTWEEVRGVWRVVYLYKNSVTERFGKKVANQLPFDASPEEKGRNNEEKQPSQARIYEIWDKETKKVYWLSKSYPKFLDVKDDPLRLECFFPTPKPLYATLTTDSLVPVPDFSLYQDQARTLDVLADRIDGLIKALKVRGCYNASETALARLFTEGDNTTLIPITNWTAFAEKAGLKGAIDIVDLTPIFGALQAAYQAMADQKNQVYEITGMSDIIRGQSVASETATAQQLKGRYASLRLKNMQMDVARFAGELLQIKAQIMCGLFDPQTLLQISAVQQLSQEDQQLIPQALDLLKQDTLREFRVEVNSDSMVEIDEAAEKEARMEFLNSVGTFMEKAGQMAAASPQTAPMVAELLKFAVTAFKVGRTIEGKLDESIDQLTKAAAQPQPPKPDPEMEKLKAEQQLQQQKMQGEQQMQQAKMQGEGQIEQMRLQMEDRRERYRIDAQLEFEKWKATLEAQTDITKAELMARHQAVAQAQRPPGGLNG
jgi:hypothetical protein